MQTRLAIAADFYLTEQIIETIIVDELTIASITAIELVPFKEEQLLRYQNKMVAQQKLAEVNWTDFDIVMFAGEVKDASIIATAMEAGCTIIDINGVCSSLDSVPVILPSINDYMVSATTKIIALPDPQISQLVLAIKDLMDNFIIDNISVTTLLPCSYFGHQAIKNLAGQTAQLLNGMPIAENQQRIAFDVSPFTAEAETTLQHKQLLQLAKLLNLSTTRVSLHQIQVPVFYGLAQLVSLDFTELVGSDILQFWQNNPLLTYHTDQIYSPVVNGEQEDTHQQLHISQLVEFERRIQFFTVADDQKFNKAMLAVKVLDKLLVLNKN